jgi:hypothetical protein
MDTDVRWVYVRLQIVQECSSSTVLVRGRALFLDWVENFQGPLEVEHDQKRQE